MLSHRSRRSHCQWFPVGVSLATLLAACCAFAAPGHAAAPALVHISSHAPVASAAAVDHAPVSTAGRAQAARALRATGAAPPTSALTPVELGSGAPGGLVSGHAQTASAVTASSPANYPLHTSGRWIENSQGQRVKLASVNWDGFESKEFVVGGLEHQTIGDIANWIASNGFNSVRIPWSNEMYEKNPVVDSTYLTANPSLDGERALDILDTVINTLGSYGLMVILDNHETDAGWCCSNKDHNGLWYTSNGDLPNFSANQWLADWEGMAARYKNNPYVVGAELRNEIRAANGIPPNWGGGGPSDWFVWSKKGGDAVLSANPNLLIFVDGLSYSNVFTGVRSHWVVLSSPGHVVYAPHAYQWDYGGGSSWSGWYSIQGYTTDSPAATEFHPSGQQPQLVVFGRGTDGQVYEDTWSEPSGPWSGWYSIGGDIEGSPAVTAFGQQVQVFARGPDNQVWTDVWTLSSSSWSGWQSIQGQISGSPTATEFSPSGQDPQVQVYARGTDGQIYEDVWTQASGWTGWYAIAGSSATTGSPSAAAFGPYQVELFADDASGGVSQDTWTLSSNAWSGWSSLGGQVTSSPSATAFGGYQMQVYARGTNGQVYSDVWTAELSGGQWTGSGSWSGWSSLGGSVVGAPAAAQFGSQMQVFAQGTNTEVYADVWSSGGYQSFENTIGTDWGYILTQGQSYTAPLWVSEWGTCITWEPSSCSQTDSDFFTNILHYLQQGDIDFAYWQLGSEQLECGCSQRTYGELDYYGLMSYPGWNGAANSAALARIQAIQAPTQGP